MLCRVPKCTKECSKTRGLCFMHLARWYRHGNFESLRKGIKHHSSGYILVMKPNHRLSDCDGYVYEHRLVAEEMLQRALVSNEIVHHKNGNKADNRPENLQVMTQEEHGYHHKFDIQPTKEWCILALRNLSEDLGKTPVRRDVVFTRPCYPKSVRIFVKLFGSWSNALVAANLSLNDGQKRSVTREKIRCLGIGRALSV